MDRTFVNGKIHECCQKPENLVGATPPDAKPGSTVKQCRVCGRRHYRMIADLSNMLKSKEA
jgi:hypothetical protein